MPNPEERSEVSLRDIAAVIGCSHATVSRALRDDKRVSAAMKEKIKAKAKEMGYRPNPMVASLMAVHNKKAGRHTLRANIAWLNVHPEKDFWHKESYSRISIESAEARARKIGYGFEELWAMEPGMNASRLKEVALARGVQGFVVPCPVEYLNDQGFDWSPFAVACLGEHHIGQLDWHRTGVSLRANVQLAYESLRKLGYRRIGFVSTLRSKNEDAQARVDAFNKGDVEGDDFILNGVMRTQLAGFLYTQAFIKPEHRVHPFLCLLPLNPDQSEHDDYVKPVAKWLKATRPEAVICGDNRFAEAIEKAGLKFPEDVAVAHLGLGEDVEGWAGIDIHKERQAAAAVDLLCAQVERNERGVPSFSKSIHIEGSWSDGWTAPPKSK